MKVSVVFNCWHNVIAIMLTINEMSNCQQEIASWSNQVRGAPGGCPELNALSPCSCHPFDEGLHIDCSHSHIRNIQNVVSKANRTIYSLTLYQLDESIEFLSRDIFISAGSSSIPTPIRQLLVKFSHVKGFDDSFVSFFEIYLKELHVVVGELDRIPPQTNQLLNLNEINFESNSISEISESPFRSLRSLRTLVLKSNLIEKISENAFHGLENSLFHLDLSENRLVSFPILPLKRLEYLRSFKLSSNRITNIFDRNLELDNLKLINLKQLDLSSNSIQSLGKDEFRFFIKLRILSLYQNLIESIHVEAFKSLSELISLDLSHNNFNYLATDLFRFNRKLKILDLSSNHLYNLNRVFSNLTELQELYLSDNNILEISDESFASCVSLKILNLEMNFIREIHERALKSLENITQIYLQNNHLTILEGNLLTRSNNLEILSLSNNMILRMDSNFFRDLSNLRELRLNSNQVRRIEKAYFENLSSLLELYLQDNLIESVEAGSFKMLEKLQYINLQNNRLQHVENDLFSSTAGSSLMILQLSSNFIFNLKTASFHFLVNLISLYLIDNHLSELDEATFKPLSKLQQLFIMNNSLSVIHSGALSPLKMLTFLNASNNQLSKLEKYVFQNLNSLEELYLSENKIEYIESGCFADLTNLKILELSGNPLNVLQNELFSLSNLIELSLRNCSILFFSIDSQLKLEKLEKLDLEMNKFPVESLRGVQMSSLKELKLSDNTFHKIPEKTFSSFKNLQILTLINCKIKEISEKAIPTRNLLVLSLDKNELENLPENLFENTSTLKELYLNHNRLPNVPGKAFKFLQNLEILEINNNLVKYLDFNQFMSIAKLQKISFQHNLIKEMVFTENNSSLPYLSDINLSSNYLHYFPPNFFATFTKRVRILNLSFNQFVNFSSLGLSNSLDLKSLNLTGNPFQLIGDIRGEKLGSSRESCLNQHISNKQIVFKTHKLLLEKTNLTIITSNDFCFYFNLQHLSLSFSKIQRISPSAFKNLNRLILLDLGCNKIDFIPKERFFGLEKLRLLNATQNLISRLEVFPRNLNYLETLDLSFNRIKQIDRHTFVNLNSLNELYLYGNQISTLSPTGFFFAKKLKLLDISRNNLENLPPKTFESFQLQIRSLKIEENPLRCGCDTQRLWEWLKEHKKITEARNLRCSEPAELKGETLMEVTPSQLCQTPSITHLKVLDIRPKSVLISWQKSPHTKAFGYRITYQSTHTANVGKMLDQNTQSARISNLKANTEYTICVYAINNWESEAFLPPPTSTSSSTSSPNPKIEDVGSLGDRPEMEPSSNTSGSESMCIATATPVNLDNELVPIDNRYQHGSILTRRLGLIIGSCTGFVVFTILVSILGYLKIKKQRLSAEKDTPLPSEYLSYRHFSFQGTGFLTAHISHGTTTLNG